MTREWFASAELASVSGMPTTRRGVAIAAKREQWPARKRQAKGGGYEYHISALPAITQSTLRAKLIDEMPDESLSTVKSIVARNAEDARRDQYQRDQARHDGMAKFVALPSAKKERARAREWIVLECVKYIEQNEYRRVFGMDHFCSDLASGLIIVPARYKPYLTHLHGQVHLAPSTLRDWTRKYQELGIYGLVDGYGTRRGQSKIEQNNDLRGVVLGCLFDTPHITAKKIHQYLQADYARLADLVNVKTIERYINRWKLDNAALWAFTTNPDLWKNHFMPAFGSHHENIERLNQLWELDSTPADVMLIDGRHSIVGVIDMYSRRMKLLVSKTSTAAAVCQVFRKAILAWGMPEAIRTDNGADYVSEQFVSVVRDLEIPQYLCIPFESQEKGTIERALQTMSHGILDLLPGFIGHNVAERKVIESRKSFAARIMQKDEIVEVSLTAADLQEKLDQWTDHIYMHDAHSGLNGKTPFEVSTAWTGTVKRISNERALDMLLCEVAGTRVIVKKGIAYNNHHYISDADGFEPGKSVQLRRDESDIGHIYVYDLDGAFICRAECHELLGISAAEAANAAKSKIKKLLVAQKQEFKENKKFIKGNISEIVIQHRIEHSKNVTALPHRSEEYTTPALEQAALAAEVKHNEHHRPELTADEQQKQAQLEREMRQPAPVAELLDTPEKRYAKAYWLERADSTSNKDADWLKIYQRGNEYKTQQMICEDFGITPEQCEAGR